MKKVVSFIIIISLIACGADESSEILSQLNQHEINKEFEEILTTTSAINVDSKIQDPQLLIYEANAAMEIFKINRDDSLRNISLNAAVRYLDLNINDTVRINKSEQIIKYLSATLFNETAKLLGNSTTNGENQKKLYLSIETKANKFLNYYKYCADEADLNQKKLELHSSLATFCFPKTELNSENFFWKNTVKNYQYILEIDSNNIHANYNLGALYFNKGADEIVKMEACKSADQLVGSLDFTDPNTIFPDITELLECYISESAEMEKANFYFRSALPYLQLVNKIQPENQEIMSAIENIHIAISDNLQK